MGDRILVFGFVVAATLAPLSVAAQTVPPLKSVSVDLPPGFDLFPGGAAAQAINSNCLACHSSDMVLYQPSLSHADWQAVIDQMRNAFKAPVVAADEPAILNYLLDMSVGK
jgi:hypothetical protein